MKKLIYDQRLQRRIEVLGDSTPSFPEDFNRRLQAFDKDLIVAWHLPPHMRRKPGRWKIEMCVQHHAAELWADGRPKHSHLCQRIYVWMVQDDEGTPLPLGDHVLDKLREMRANSERFGGQTERGLRNFREHSKNIDAELEAKRQAASADMLAHNRRDKRAQFNKLMTLIERHDMRPNK